MTNSDYVQLYTLVMWLLLLFAVPPQKPLVLDDRGRQVEVGDLGVGPYREGDTVTIDCHVPGGQLWLVDLIRSLLSSRAAGRENVICVF